ncbi:hypothetical protein PRIPAC_77593, partial [Pristionchus pacificus]
SNDSIPSTIYLRLRMEENLSTSLLVNDDNSRNRRGFWRKVFEIINSEDDEDLTDTEPVSFFQLFRYASRRDICAYFFGSFVSMIIGLVTPAYFYVVSLLTTIYVNEKTPIGNDEFLWKVWTLASLYCVGWIICLALEFTQSYFLSLASERIAQKCRSAFIAAILSRDTLSFSASTGELSSQLSSHIDRMKDGIGDRIGLFVKSLSTFISCCIFSFFFDWQTALFMFWAGPIYLVCSSLVPMMSKKATKTAQNKSEEANGISEECILNVKTVASCNGQNQMIERYASILQSGVPAAVRVAFSAGFLYAIEELVHFTFNALGLWYATLSYHSGRVSTAGDVFAVVYLSLAGSYAFSMLGPSIIVWMKARVAAAKIYETIDSAKTVKDEEKITLLDPSRTDLHVEFRNVSFSFPSRSQPVLESLSFDLEPGMSIGLVGKSGCGKSTTIKLITRFLTTDFGHILLDGVSLEKYDKKKWRQMMGVVSQEPCLFSGSIRENICLGRPFTDKEVEHACKTAFAHDFIMALDKGYDTLIGSSGVSLSGGQKQRIGIARAIVSNPRLLLLDEATSALDTKSERIVQEALDNASQGRSTIVIAHRLSTIKNVDQVIVMESGKVVERGGYDELRTKPDGIFARMVTEQAIERRKSREIHAVDSGSSLESVTVDDPDVGMITEQIQEQSFPSMTGGIIALLARNKGKTCIVLFLGLLRGFASPLFALRYFFLFGSLEDENYESLLFWTMAGTLMVGVYNFFCQLTSQPICQYLAETVMNDLRVSTLRSLLNRPMAYFDRESTSPSACAVLLAQQPPLFMSMLDNKLAVVVDGLFGCIAMLVLTFVVCPPVGFVGLFYLISFMSILLICEKFSDRAYKAVVAADKSGEVAMEIFDNVATIQQIAVEEHFQGKYDEMLRIREGPLKKKVRYQSLVHATNESIFYLFDFFSTAIGVYFVYLGYYNAKLLYLAENLVSTVGYKTFTMSESFKEMVSASSAAKLVFNLIDPTMEKYHDQAASSMVVEGSVRGESLSFAYPSQPNKKVLQDVSFSSDNARSLAFVGPSGGGKSTLVNLLEKFYDPIEGQLFLDEIPFSDITPSQLRSNIALVSQEPILFRGTISDNIRLGVTGVSDEYVRAVCKQANASEFIQDFPEGYETLVGEKGRSLSGGQKQRIAIARALVRNPKVIILDEATSALDTQSEKVVRVALESSAQGRTSVMIAHRLDTIKHCDEICFVEGGRIVERGSHSELIARRGRYYEMTEQQSLH